MTLRETQGSPIWLPPGAGEPHLVKRERRAYESGEEAKAMIETGLFETGASFVFRCPLCGRQERNDQRLEPMCSGPTWRNEHPPEIMQQVA
jgi:hypothetical protein